MTLHITQALQEHLRHRGAAANQQHTSSSDADPGTAQQAADGTLHQHSEGDDTLLQACQYSSISPSFSSSTAGSLSLTAAASSSSGQHSSRQPAASVKQQTPLWKQQVQQEKQMLHARQKQAAAEAAARSRSESAQKQAASCQLAQQQLPFQVQHSQTSRGATHKLQPSLSMILREAAAKQGGLQGFAAPDPIAAPVGPTQLPTRTRGTLVSAPAASAQHGAQTMQQQSVGDPRPDTGRLQSCSSPRASISSCQGQGAHSSLHRSGASLGGSAPRAGSLSSSRSRLDIGGSKQQFWATADAQTDAEVSSYLLEHWQQQHMATAALVLQCAWRSRAARLSFSR